MDERMLRHALMEANLERFRDVLDAAEEPDWSHRYLRNRTRLLADPFGWAKRMARPVWKRAARTAACVLLACLVTLGGLMAVSPGRPGGGAGVVPSGAGGSGDLYQPEADRGRGSARRLAAVGDPGGLCADGRESQGELGLLEVL